MPNIKNEQFYKLDNDCESQIKFDFCLWQWIKRLISNGVHLKKINKFNINKTNTKIWAKTVAVEISQIMDYNNAQVKHIN